MFINNINSTYYDIRTRIDTTRRYVSLREGLVHPLTAQSPPRYNHSIPCRSRNSSLRMHRKQSVLEQMLPVPTFQIAVVEPVPLILCSSAAVVDIPRILNVCV